MRGEPVALSVELVIPKRNKKSDISRVSLSDLTCPLHAPCVRRPVVGSGEGRHGPLRIGANSFYMESWAVLLQQAPACLQSNITHVSRGTKTLVPLVKKNKPSPVPFIRD